MTNQYIEQQGISIIKAIAEGDVDKIDKLIIENPELLLMETTGAHNNLGHLAAINNDIEVIRYFIAKGVNLTQKNKAGHTPLQLLKKDASVIIRKELLEGKDGFKFKSEDNIML